MDTGLSVSHCSGELLLGQTKGHLLSKWADFTQLEKLKLLTFSQIPKISTLHE
jgi:hypothetical protein